MTEYQVGLRTSCRLLPNGEPVYGLAWEINRRLPEREGEWPNFETFNRRLPEREGEWPNFETLMVSKDVFEFEDDAKRDAVRTLKSFGCCEDSPFRKAFRTVVEWMVDEA